MSRDRRRDVTASESARLERSTEWAGLRSGDPVEVAGDRARSTSWSFLAHVRNVRTGDEWVEIVGGRAGRRAVRSFRPEQIFAPSPRRTGRATRTGRAPRAPLSEAPRLPL